MRCKGCLVALAAILSGFAVALPVEVRGDVIVSLNNPGSTTLHGIEIEPGETFSLDVNLSTDVSVGWVRTAVQASASGVFDVLEVVDHSPWTSQGTSYSMVGGIDPTSGAGAFTYLNTPPGFGPGTGTLATILVAIDDAAAPSTYTFEAADILWTESPANPERWPGEGGSAFIVHVIPEPSTIALIIPFVPLLLQRRF